MGQFWLWVMLMVISFSGICQPSNLLKATSLENYLVLSSCSYHLVTGNSLSLSCIDLQVDHCKGQLFVYGGDAIGSDEVMTVLQLDRSSGIESLECVGRLDLTLNGSFADMVLLTSEGTSEASGTIVLTNPGQLHFYDDHCLASVMSQKEKKNQVSLQCSILQSYQQQSHI